MSSATSATVAQLFVSCVCDKTNIFAQRNATISFRIVAVVAQCCGAVRFGDF